MRGRIFAATTLALAGTLGCGGRVDFAPNADAGPRTDTQDAASTPLAFPDSGVGPEDSAATPRPCDAEPDRTSADAPAGDAPILDASDASTATGVVVADGLNDPYYIVADDQGVFWGDWRWDGGVVMGAPLDGGPAVIIAPAESLPLALALDPVRVCWVGQPVGLYDVNIVACAPREGGPVAVVAQNVNGGLAIDSNAIYWTAGAFVMNAPLDGGPATTATGQSPNFLAVDATHVYWTDLGPDAGAGALLSVPVDGGAVETLAASLGSPQRLAVDGEELFWIDFGADPGGAAGQGSILRIGIDGGTPIVVAGGLAAPLTMAIDSADLYWNDYAAGGATGLWHLARTGGSTAPIPTIGVAFALAQNTTSIFYTSLDSPTSQVIRFDK
jgi:hypothetical protein